MKFFVHRSNSVSRVLQCFGVALMWIASSLLSITQALEPELRFQRVFDGTETIKSNASSLTSIVQDKTGFMWFGGENGLARFDGVQFKLYQQSDLPGGLPSSYVRDLILDKKGELWIATDRGLCRYYPETESFEVFRPDPNNPQSIAHNVVTTMTLDNDNNLILGTATGISILDPERKVFTNDPLSSSEDSLTFVLDVMVDTKNRLWVASRDHGLFLLDHERRLVRQYYSEQSNPKALQSDTVKAIEEDQFGRIWVGTYGGGVSRINEGERSFTTYLFEPEKVGSIGSNTIWDIYLDSEDTLWFATDQGGLASYQPSEDNFKHFKYSAFDKTTLTSNQVRTIYEDHEDNLWVATFPNGINFYDRNHSHVSNFTHIDGDLNSLSNSAVLDFLQTSDGVLWVGTEDGLNMFDLEKQRFIGRHVKDPKAKNGLQANAVLSLTEDYNGDLWIGTWSGGLHRFNRIKQTFDHFVPDRQNPHSLNSAFIWDLYLDSQNNLWIATETGGLNRYDRSTESFTHYTHNQTDNRSISSNFVWSMLEDSRGRFWVATADGLDVLDRQTGTFLHYRKDANNPKTLNSVRIRTLMEDSRGRIWVGSQDAGAFYFDYTTDQFKKLNWPESLAVQVTSFVEDNLGYVWASTTNGLGRIDPQTGVVRSFHKSHGLVGDNYNRDATFKDKRGRLYFGSTDGFSVFDPRSFSTEVDNYPVVITNFQLSNRPVQIGGADSPLNKSITYTDHLVLQHGYAMFSFSFAALNFRVAPDNRYSYILDGFDQDWHHVGTHNWATYTNISPGDYVFKVKSSDRDDVWNRNEAKIKITVLPPPWQSIWAYLFYGFSFVLVGLFMVRTFLKHVELKNQRALNSELLRVNKIKDAFLVNSSHELRLPISSMIGLAESILRDEKNQLLNHTEHRLNLIVGHGKRLSNLINDVLDYGAFSNREIELHSAPEYLPSLIDSVFQQLQPLTFGKPVALVNAVERNCPFVDGDRRHIKQVISNIVSNAIKYTDQGEVRVSAKAEGTWLFIEIRDTGRGIPPDQQDKIFCSASAETISEQALTGVGLGLSVSKQLVELHRGTIDFKTVWADPKKPEEALATGTTFRFCLPIAKDSTPAAASEAGTEQPITYAAGPEERTLRQKKIGDKLSVLPCHLQKQLVGDLAPPEHGEGFTVLIVDDDPVNRMVLSGILRLHQYQILEAGSGSEALNILLKDCIGVDLVILDVMMPRMSGFEVCAKLRQTYQQEALPIVFLTAKYGEEDVKKGLDSGGNEVLYKPVSKEELLPRVKYYLEALDQHRRLGGTS